MYVIKVGKYYVKNVDVWNGGYVGNIELSREIMRQLPLKTAQVVANLIGGKVEEIQDNEEIL